MTNRGRRPEERTAEARCNRTRATNPPDTQWYTTPPPPPVQPVAYDATHPLLRGWRRRMGVPPKYIIAQPEAIRTDFPPPRYEYPVMTFMSELPSPSEVQAQTDPTRGPASQSRVHHGRGETAAQQTARKTAPRPQLCLDDLASFEISDSTDPRTCAICLERLVTKPVSSGSCLHIIHTSCLTEWLQRDSDLACPVCREKCFDSIVRRLPRGESMT